MTLIELRKLAEAATQGEWENNGTRVYLPQNLGGFDIRNAPNANVNAAYIAAVNPAAVISLLNQIQSLQAENERLTVERDTNKRMRDLHFAEKSALAAKLAAMEADAERWNFAVDQQDWAICQWQEDRERWKPINNYVGIDAAIKGGQHEDA
jgi:maltooligosyltrehalose synthase